MFGTILVQPTTTLANHHCKIPNKGDLDNNGIGDAGVQVVCNYKSVYAYDSSGAYYWDLGDGRVYTSSGITSVASLNQATLTVCDYQVNTKGDFGNDPFLNSGVITNNINCNGYDGKATYYYQIVHKTDPRFTGNPEWAEYGGDWEYHVLTVSGQGNLVRRPPASGGGGS